jgi:dipeptidyl aminopeptidase/acylaminoacyl peptidase
MKRILYPLLLILCLSSSFAAQRAFTAGDLLAVKRVGDPQVSPDGRSVAFTVGTVDKAANRVITQIYTMNIDGSNQRQITKAEKSSSSPRWSPDGRRIAFVNEGQIWTMRPDGGDREQVTKISTGAGGPVWSPDGRWIAFTSEVYPECTTDDCNKAEDERVEASKVKAHVTERLLYRHWVEWRDRKRTHVFVVPARGGAARDLTPGDYDSPPYAASSSVDYGFSPDSAEIAYLRNPDKVEAISTNSDIYVVRLSGGDAKNITAANRGYDATPIYTPDGKYIIYRSQATAGFEADRWRIMRYDRASGQTIELTAGFDQQADELAVSSDGKTVYFTANLNGRNPIFAVPVEPAVGSRNATSVKEIVPGVSAGGLRVSSDGTLVFASGSANAPAEIFRASAGGQAAPITQINAEYMKAFGLRALEDVQWKGALNQTVHGFLLKPANWGSLRRNIPLIVLIHGGPQGAWLDNWGYRWNPQVFANAGYAVFMPNPRGSSGYGQRFLNEVSADWGGRAYIDIMNGVAAVLKDNPWIRSDRVGAAGASYGGYMVDWLLGHNNDPRFKFKAFVSHAGVYNLESMAGATEELWFVNWEFKGMPWENTVNYNRWSPHKFAKNFNTPTLVTCGELDYRVPVDQSYQLFTALQLRNVPSKLIVFPDEGHWILKPQNSEFWYRNVLDWFQNYLNR